MTSHLSVGRLAVEQFFSISVCVELDVPGWPVIQPCGVHHLQQRGHAVCPEIRSF